jgi:hypothetical protein
MATKPVISYVANQILPLIPELNVSVIQKKVSKTEFINWANKTELTDYVDLLYVHPLSDCYIYLQCQCGMIHEFVNKAAVPDTNLTCDCGRKLIEYGN